MNAAPTSAIIPTRGANAPNKAVALAATAPNACMMLVSVFAPSIPFIADSFQRQYRVV